MGVILAPLMIPSEARVARLMVAIYAGVLVMKLWDLHVGVDRGFRPTPSEMVQFMVNPMSLVHPFLAEHAAKATTFSVFATAFFDGLGHAVRLMGGAVVLTLRARPNRFLGIAGTFGFNVVSSVLFLASFEGMGAFYSGGLPPWI